MADRSNDNDVVFEFADAESARQAVTELRDHGVDLAADGKAVPVPLALHDQVSVTLLRHGGHAVHPELDEAPETTPSTPPSAQA